MAREGYGRGYMYAHEYNKTLQEKGADRPPAQRLQAYLPEQLAGHHYYQPGSAGHEVKLSAWLEERRRSPAPLGENDIP